jgi:hypothetical protein
MGADARMTTGVDAEVVAEVGAEVGASGPAPGDVRLTSVHNFRDVAGPGYALHPTGSMVRGLVYRSTTLSVGEDDLGVLERLGVSVALTRDDQRVLTAVVTGRPVPATTRTLLRVAGRHLLMTHRVSVLIRWHGVRLWLARLPVMPRPTHSAEATR